MSSEDRVYNCIDNAQTVDHMCRKYCLDLKGKERGKELVKCFRECDFNIKRDIEVCRESSDPDPLTEYMWVGDLSAWSKNEK